jgi:hypothetical protein
MPGPAPDPNARHRNGLGSPPGRKGAGVLRLPAEGRKGPVPAWPLDTSNPAEVALWRDVWTWPQAVAWDKQGTAHREVAMYVRWSLLAERADPKAAVEARMLSDRLGLTPMAMRRLMWEVVPDEVGERRDSRASSSPARRRTKIKAVDPVDTTGG